MVEQAETTPIQMELAEWLDDLTVRFLLNLPRDELSSMPRLCFQAEEAQWYYEDFIRPLNPKLPSLNLRQFVLTLFKHCPLFNMFSEAQHTAAYEEFLAYKVRVPVRGAILLDESMEQVLLVRGWKKGSSWSFPRGKINKNEKDIDCAIREVWEETGFDIRAAGLDKPESQGGHVKAIDMVMKEQHLKLFVFRGVALDTHFEPRTRKEIGGIQWYPVKDLPGYKKQKAADRSGQAAKYYMVAPFLGPLKKWIHQQRASEVATLGTHSESLHAPTLDHGIASAEANSLLQALVRPSVATPSDDLKRLLSIGSPPSAEPPVQQQQQMEQHSQPADASALLAMLQGNSSRGPMRAPQTPFDQVNPPTPLQQPQTPQPHHPRHHSMGASNQNQMPPQFPWSPQMMLHSQQTPRDVAGLTASTPDTFGRGPGQISQMSQRWTGHPSLHAQQPREPQRQSIRTSAVAPNAAGHPWSSEMPDTLVDHHAHGNAGQMHPHARAPHAPHDLHRQLLLDSLTSIGDFRGTSGAPVPPNQHPRTTVSGPEVPDASQLPTPRLDPHARKLLDAFSTPNSRQGGSANTQNRSSAGQAFGGQHQNALLGLLTKAAPATVPPPPATAAPVQAPQAPASPTLSDTTIRSHSRANPERRPTLNEITRTLHPTFRTRTPPDGDAAAVVAPPQPSKREQPQTLQSPKAPAGSNPKSVLPVSFELMERPKSRGQLFDPKNPKTNVHAPTNDHKSKKSNPQAQNKTSSKIARSAGPEPAFAGNGPPGLQYSILQRPGSSAAARSPTSQGERISSTDPATALSFQPKVLKRPTVDNGDHPIKAAIDATPDIRPSNDKKDQLLALFGPSPTPAMAAPGPAPRAASQPKHASLGLLATDAAALRPVSKNPEPPSAPHLLPERNPSHQGKQANKGPPSQQQQLLDLFNRRSPSTVVSPGTPISPFALGTPASKTPMPLNLPVHAPPRSRLGSATSPSASGALAPTSTVTPTETKGMLLGILNGVWEKEGRSGKKV